MSHVMGRCQLCGAHAPVKKLWAAQMIGMIVVFQYGYVNGMMCRRCIDRELMKRTGISLLLGWWGVISFFLNWIVLAANFAAFCVSRGLPRGEEIATGQGQVLPVAAPPPYALPANAPQGRAVQIRMHDGQVVFGTFLESRGDQVLVRLEDGRTLWGPASQVVDA